MDVYPLGGKGGIQSDLMSSPIEYKRRLKTATLDSFSSAGASGMAFARTTSITIPANSGYSVKLQKNANVAVRFIHAEGLYIEAVSGVPSGELVELDVLLSTNGIISSGFIGSIEIYDATPIGVTILGRQDELLESFYPDGELVVALVNTTDAAITTFLSIGVEQLSDTGVYIILEPSTQLELTTEMSQYNGTN